MKLRAQLRSSLQTEISEANCVFLPHVLFVCLCVLCWFLEKGLKYACWYRWATGRDAIVLMCICICVIILCLYTFLLLPLAPTPPLPPSPSLFPSHSSRSIWDSLFIHFFNFLVLWERVGGWVCVCLFMHLYGLFIWRSYTPASGEDQPRERKADKTRP